MSDCNMAIQDIYTLYIRKFCPTATVFLHLTNYPNTSSLLKIADTFTNTFAFYSKKCYSPFPVSLFIIVSYLKQYNVVFVHRLVKSV
ncbi:hypothetical protein DWX98_13975 [Blautia sp. AF22-5LB]|nr:hypothetical protein DWX98_13975 [Blautia sp. AF22-5LB]